MVLRSREGRRRAPRSPGILRGDAPPVERRSVQHGVREGGLPAWRLISGVLVLMLIGALVFFFVADIFYVHTIGVGGLRYLAKEEVFALTDIADMHVFWVDPETVRRSILRSPSIADARVDVGWPPVMVQVVLEERQPALVWQQAGVVTWIDLGGRVMQQREDRPDLLRVEAVNLIEGPLGPNTRLETDIVNGALQLRTLFPGQTALRYHPDKGLGLTDARGWDVWFGIGVDMQGKLLIYEAIVDNLLTRGIQPVEINVVNPDAPFYATAWGR